MEIQAHRVEHLLQFRQGVGPHGRGEFPRSLAVEDDLSSLEAPSQQVERRVLEDDGSVVPSLPGWVRETRDEAVPIAHHHQELAAGMERAGHPTQKYAILFRSGEFS